MHVWVTRDEPPDGPLGRALARRGLAVIAAPVVARRPIDDARDALRALGPDDWLVLTSAFTIEAIDLDAARVPRVAVVGRRTRAAAEASGLRVSLVGRGPGAAGLLDELLDASAGSTICHPRASGAPLLSVPAGTALVSPVVYETTPVAYAPDAANDADVVAVTSPSAARIVARCGKPLASLGPTTSAALRAEGVEPWVEAPRPDFESLAAVIVAAGVVPAAARPRRRPRRLRRTPALRGLVRETRVSPERLVLPLFVIDGTGVAEAIDALPGHARLSIDGVLDRCRAAAAVGVRAFALFPVIDPALKTPGAEAALDGGNVLCRAVRAVRTALPEACVITDVALDPYSSLGHDGLVVGGEVVNDATVDRLARMAVLHASAGADVVAPSDMMDGRVAAIRAALDGAGHVSTAILSYAVKYASALYGPFRAALDSAPVDAPDVPADKATYQMDPANAREAMVELALDEAEGADILMVKPAMTNLDVIARARRRTDLPIAAYQVSGEYAMIRAAAARGWLDERACLNEALTAIARAGADVIVSYDALDYARWFRTRDR